MRDPRQGLARGLAPFDPQKNRRDAIIHQALIAQAVVGVSDLTDDARRQYIVMRDNDVIPLPLPRRIGLRDEPLRYTVSMSPDTITTILTGIGVLFGVWRLIEGVRRDLTNQIAGVNTRIDNVLLAERRQT